MNGSEYGRKRLFDGFIIDQVQDLGLTRGNASQCQGTYPFVQCTDHVYGRLFVGLTLHLILRTLNSWTALGECQSRRFQSIQNLCCIWRSSWLRGYTFEKSLQMKDKDALAVDWLTRKILHPMHKTLGCWQVPLQSVQSCCTRAEVQGQFCNRH